MFRLAVILASALAAGCASHADRLAPAQQAYFAGNLRLARAKIDEQIVRCDADANVFKLDRAIVDLVDGRPADAERTLREVRDAFDHFQQASAGEFAASMLADANQKSYAGEDYERVLVRVFLALSNLMGDGGDAAAYSLQANDVQEQIIQAGAVGAEENPKLAYKRVAAGAYLHAALREETHANYDDAARSFARVCEWAPGFAYGRRDVERATYDRHSRPGNGVAYVFALVGRGPYKIETAEVPSTVSLLIADRILSHNARHTVAPTVAPIKAPKVVAAPNVARGVLVTVDGQSVGAASTLTDIGDIAVQQCDALHAQVLAEAVARRVAKKGVLYAGKEAAGVANASLLNVGLDLAGVVWEATETADTRCWALLPDRIQVLRLELPAGRHRLGLRAEGAYGPLGAEEVATVAIEDGRNAYVLASFPQDRLVGKILVSGGAGR